MVFSYAPALIMTTTTVFPKYIIDNYTEGNKSGVEILNNTTIGIQRTQEIQKNVQEYIAISKTT